MRPVVAGMNEFFTLKVLHLGTIHLQPDGNSLYSLNRGDSGLQEWTELF